MNIKLLIAIVWLSVMVGCSAAVPKEPAPVIGKDRAAETPARADSKTDWERKVAEAQKEGELVVYSTAASGVRVALSEAFRNKFGLKLDFVTGRGPEITSRVVREKNAGLFIADVVTGGGTLLTQGLKPEGILADLEPLLILPEVKNPKAWRAGKPPFLDKEHKAIAFVGVVERYIVRNTEMVKDGEIESFKDLLRPEWKAKLVMNDPSVSGSGSAFITVLAQIWGVDAARDYMRQLVKQEPVITRNWRQQVEWTARGRYPISIAPNTDNVIEFKKNGAPISGVIVREGSKLGSSTGCLGVPANVVHPNASIVFVNWLLSQEGQSLWSKTAGVSSERLDVPNDHVDPERKPGPGENYVIGDEEHFNLQTPMMKIAQEIFSPLIR